MKNVYLSETFSKFEIKNKLKQNVTLGTTDPLLFMNDFSIGLQYVINKKTGKCTLLPLKRNIKISFDQSKFNITDNLKQSIEFAFQLQSTKSFIKNGTTYVFTKMEERNGVYSEIYVSKTDQGVYEYAFSNVIN